MKVKVIMIMEMIKIYMINENYDNGNEDDEKSVTSITNRSLCLFVCVFVWKLY